MIYAFENNLAGLGAVLAGVGGVITAWTAIRKSKMEGSQTCHELLNQSRLEAEQYAAELHRIKINHPEYKDSGIAVLWMVGSIGLFCAATALGLMSLGLVGDTGSTGPQGPQGNQGIPGPVGPKGLPGLVGPVGPIGPTGNLGPQGLPGNDGSPGPVGEQGIPGEVGQPGTNGLPGPQGIQGEPGPTCPTGFTPTTIGVHQREPTDQDTMILACVAQ